MRPTGSFPSPPTVDANMGTQRGWVRYAIISFIRFSICALFPRAASSSFRDIHDFQSERRGHPHTPQTFVFKRAIAHSFAFGTMTTLKQKAFVQLTEWKEKLLALSSAPVATILCIHRRVLRSRRSVENTTMRFSPYSHQCFQSRSLS